MQAAKRRLLLQLEETRNTVERQRLLKLLWQLDRNPVDEKRETNRDPGLVPAAVAVG